MNEHHVSMKTVVFPYTKTKICKLYRPLDTLCVYYIQYTYSHNYLNIHMSFY